MQEDLLPPHPQLKMTGANQTKVRIHLFFNSIYFKLFQLFLNKLCSSCNDFSATLFYFPSTDSSRPKSSKKVSKDGKEASSDKRESSSSSSRPKSAAKRRDEG